MEHPGQEARPRTMREPSCDTSSEEKIISRIINDGVLQHETREGGVFHVLLYYGSKKLECFVRKDASSAGAIIETLNDSARMPGETTIVYKALLRVLQGAANRLARDIEYTFLTTNANLILWANAAGREIFGWEEKTYGDIRGYKVKIRPTMTAHQLSKRSVDRETRRLTWDYRDETRKRRSKT